MMSISLTEEQAPGVNPPYIPFPRQLSWIFIGFQAQPHTHRYKGFKNLLMLQTESLKLKASADLNTYCENIIRIFTAYIDR